MTMHHQNTQKILGPDNHVIIKLGSGSTNGRTNEWTNEWPIWIFSILAMAIHHFSQSLNYEWSNKVG